MLKTPEEKANIAVLDLKSFYAVVECVERGLDPFATPLVVADKLENCPFTIL
jgi:DNA polymerase V